jgi:elongation factor P
MITAGDFKKGLTVELDGGVWTIVDFQHVKPGKGAAFVRTKIKNIMTGSVLERTFNPTDKMPKAIVETKEMQYLYTDGDLYHFMDTESYEQIALTREQVEDAIPFVKEETNVTVRFFKGAPFSVAAPNFVELKVIETEPGFRGDTATGTTKPATVETGYTCQVPLFVEVGDVLRIDTRTGEYMERA